VVYNIYGEMLMNGGALAIASTTATDNSLRTSPSLTAWAKIITHFFY
jgi:hypothetical protein